MVPILTSLKANLVVCRNGGYDRNEINALYEPDDNFPYIRKGWEMLLEGCTRPEIVEYWNQHNVHRDTKIDRKKTSILAESTLRPI